MSCAPFYTMEKSEGRYKDNSALTFPLDRGIPTVLRAVSVAIRRRLRKLRDGLPGLDLTTSRVDVQTAVDLLDALSPVNV